MHKYNKYIRKFAVSSSINDGRSPLLIETLYEKNELLSTRPYEQIEIKFE